MSSTVQTQTPETGGRVVLLNALPINAFEKEAILVVRPVTVDHVKSLIQSEKFVSYIGHESTAKLLSQLLGVNVPTNRAFYKAQDGDILVIVVPKQRLPEGKVLNQEEIQKMLQEGKIGFYIVTVMMGR